TRHPGERRAEDWKNQHAVEDVVAIFVEERLLTVVQVNERARMRDNVGILIGRGRLDLDLPRHCGCKRLARRIDGLRQRCDNGIAGGFPRHQVLGKAQALEAVVGRWWRAAERASIAIDRIEYS